MANYLERLTERDIATLAVTLGREHDELRSDLRLRPWMLHEVLSNDDVFEVVLDRRDHPAAVVSAYLLFAVLVHRVAGELREARFVHDWSGPRARLPVFDVEPLREFASDPGRLFYLVGLLTSFAAPAPPPVPADPFDLHDLAAWLRQVLPHHRTNLLLRLGDLSLFLSGVYPDRTGLKPLRPAEAVRLGESVGMTSDEILTLTDPARLGPGLDALEALGSRWYSAAAESGEAPLVIFDVASRFQAARRVLNQLTDTYLYKLDLRPEAA